MSLSNKSSNLIITGTSRGIGQKMAEHYLSHGWNVHGISRTGSNINNKNYYHYELDLTDINKLNIFFSNYKKKYKNLYGLINNAGTLTSMNSLLIPGKNVDEMINLNIKSNFFMTRESAKIMIKGKFGRIINIGSMALKLEPSGDSVYAMTKAAISTLSRILSKEYSPYGITSNSVNITYIETQLSKRIEKKAIEKIIKNLPIPREACFDDIINVIDFYLSANSDYITGQDISLGGL